MMSYWWAIFHPDDRVSAFPFLESSRMATPPYGRMPFVASATGVAARDTPGNSGSEESTRWQPAEIWNCDLRSQQPRRRRRHVRGFPQPDAMFLGRDNFATT